MGTYEELKAAIQQVIRTNGNNEITGALLQNALLSIVNVVGANATFAGIATPNTNPGTADQNVFYLATEAGTYINFNNIVLEWGEVGIIANKNNSWEIKKTGLVSEDKFTNFSTTLSLKKSLIDGEYYDVNGIVGKSELYKRLPITKVGDTLSIIGFNAKMLGDGGCRLYNERYEYIGDISFSGKEENKIYPIPENAKYFGFYIKSNVVLPDNALIETPKGIVTDIINTLNDISLGDYNILQDINNWKGGYINSEGTERGITSVPNSDVYKYVLIPVNEGEQFIYNYQGIRNDLNVFLDSNLQKVGANIYAETGINVLTAPANAVFLGITIKFGANDDYTGKWLVKRNTVVGDIAFKLSESNIWDIVNISELIIPNSLWQPGGYAANVDTFDRTELIKAKKGFYYRGCVINNVRCFNANKQWISDEAISNINGYVTLSDDTEYIGVNFRKSNQPLDAYESAFFVFDNNKLVPILMQPGVETVLTNKKWCFVGDSFSAGLGLESFTDGIFSGKPKTYPYFIAMRNGMTNLVNDAISGSAMTYNPNDARTNNAFSVNRYKNIPADVDYITIYIGINDANYQSVLGTIDDNTNETFYGAWNVVLTYLIQNHPNAKIGIIVTNGSAPQYTQAEREIAKKYGLPYLDMELDLQVPYFLRQAEKVAAQNIPNEIVSLRTNYYALNPPGDTHPNEKAHEFESTFIEAWLKTL